jgi:KDO2-lipid IV(A) lauroyltransferase
MANKHTDSKRVENQTYRQFIRLKYVPTFVMFGVFWLITRLPYALLMAFGRAIGRLAYRTLKSRRQVCESNIRLCFPDLTPDEQTALAKQTFRSFGQGLLETAFAWSRDTDKLADRTHIEGLDHVRAAHAEGRGVLLVGGHFALVDLAGGLVKNHLDFHVVQRDHDNPLFNLWMTRARLKSGKGIVARKDLRTMLRVLKNKGVLWYAPDQDYGRRDSVFVPFFGIETATITGTSRLAKMTNAAVVPIFFYRRLDGHYCLEFSKPLPIPSGDDVADAAYFNQWLETQVRRYPEQYLWLHKRFKTRPEGEPSLY